MKKVYRGGCEIAKQKIYDTLKNGYFNAAFEGHTMCDRVDIIWNELGKHLTQKEWGNVFLSIGMLPEDVKIL